MISTIKVDLERQWTWGCTSSYTAVAGVAQLQNVKRLKTKTLPTRAAIRTTCASMASSNVQSFSVPVEGTQFSTNPLVLTLFFALLFCSIICLLCVHWVFS